MTRRGVSHYNTLRAPLTDDLGDTQSIKAEFARRLQGAMIQKGWNQSELARRASERLPRPSPGQKRHHLIGRDLVSHYIRGKMLPGPVVLEAIASALGLKPSDLMPAGVPAVRAPADVIPLEMRGLPDGRLYLRVNRAVSQENAMKIMAILADEDRGR